MRGVSVRPSEVALYPIGLLVQSEAVLGVGLDIAGHPEQVRPVVVPDVELAVGPRDGVELSERVVDLGPVVRELTDPGQVRRVDATRPEVDTQVTPDVDHVALKPHAEARGRRIGP